MEYTAAQRWDVYPHTIGGATCKNADCWLPGKVQTTTHQLHEQKAIKTLTHRSHCHCSSWKGNATVVMDQTDFDGKIRKLLADANTYKRLQTDPTAALERQINALLLSLSRVGAIPGPLYERLRSSAGKIPLLYELPKVHKAGTPLKPIVYFVNSSTYQLCKHLVSILSPLVGKTDSYLRKSADFATLLQGSRSPMDPCWCLLTWCHSSQMFRLTSQRRWLVNSSVWTPHWQSAWRYQQISWQAFSGFALMRHFWPTGEISTNKPLAMPWVPLYQSW